MKVLLTILGLLFGLGVFAQSESNVPYTRDTIINEFSGNGPGSGTFYASPWHVRLTTQLNDPTPRPTWICMPGAGEVGTDSNYFHLFGYHYWIQHGWDGGILLGNGKHFPNGVTVIQPASNMRSWHVLALFDTILAHYPQIEPGSIHLMGLSQGSYIWGSFLLYGAFAGDETAMSMIRSYTNLQGVGPDTYNTTSWAYPTGYGHWAKKFGGRFWGLEGIGDTRNVWQISKSVNDSVPNAGYFSWSKDGTPPGSHCCWNDDYDPNQKDWRNSPIATNPYLTTGSPANTPGSYRYDPALGTSLFKWALQQGDTALKGGCNPAVNAGAPQSIYLPGGATTLTGSSVAQCGNLIITRGWSQISGPNTATITTPSGNDITGISGMIAGTYVFQLTAMDNIGLTGSAQVTVIVNAAVPPTVTVGGPYTINYPTSTSVSMTSTATGNGGATISSYQWTYVSGPTGYTITTPTAQNTTVTGLVVGNYVFKMTATDNNGNTGSANASIAVTTTTFAAASNMWIPGEYTTAWIKVGTLYGISSNPNLTGAGGGGVPGGAVACSTPAGVQFYFATPILHGIVAISTVGDFYSYGGNTMGAPGVGIANTTPNLATPVKGTTDSAGNPMGVVSLVQGTYAANSAEGCYFVKKGTASDTLLMAGATGFGLRGDGKFAFDTVTRPVKVWAPVGRRITQLAAEKYGIALLDNGDVYTTGGSFSKGTPPNYAFLGYTPSNTAIDYLSWHKITFPAGFVANTIAGGDVCGTIVVGTNGGVQQVFAWGPYSGYLFNGANTSYPLPVDITATVNINIPSGIRPGQIVCNSNSWHCISNNGLLYGWGDNGQGCVGNGVEIDFANYAPFYYQYDPATILGLPQTLPVQISNRTDWVAVYSQPLFGFTTFAVTATGDVYSWGRNKGGVLGNGVIECVGSNGTQANFFSNAWDQTRPILIYQNGGLIDPRNLVAGIPVICKRCVDSPNVQYCLGVCTNPATVAHANAGSNQVITTTAALLSATASNSTGGKVVGYLWSQVSGPNTATFDLLASPLPIVSGLTAGTYIFQVLVTDNGWSTSTATVQVTVGSSGAGSQNKIYFRRKIRLINH